MKPFMEKKKKNKAKPVQLNQQAVIRNPKVFSPSECFWDGADGGRAPTSALCCPGISSHSLAALVLLRTVLGMLRTKHTFLLKASPRAAGSPGAAL